MKNLKLYLKFSSKVILYSLIGLLFLVIVPKFSNAGEEKWPGVDSTVVEKYAKKYGVEPREPFINTDQGDLLLFIFTLAGATGGFVMGYNFRKIFKEKRSDSVSRT